MPLLGAPSGTSFCWSTGGEFACFSRTSKFTALKSVSSRSIKFLVISPTFLLVEAPRTVDCSFTGSAAGALVRFSVTARRLESKLWLELGCGPGTSDLLPKLLLADESRGPVEAGGGGGGATGTLNNPLILGRDCGGGGGGCRPYGYGNDITARARGIRFTSQKLIPGELFAK